MYFHLNLILATILKDYFQNCRCVLQIWENIEPPIVHNFPTVTLKLNNASLENLNYEETQRCEGFIIISKDPATIFSNLEDYIKKMSEVRYNNRKYIIITLGEAVIDSINMAVLNYVPNFLLIKYFNGIKIKNQFGTEADYGFYELFTHRYVGTGDAHGLYLLDVWDVRTEGFMFKANLFPDKISNQHGRVLRIGAIEYIPYCIKESQRGTELAFIFQYAKIRNMTPIIVSPNGEVWGQIFNNWTGYGILGNLVMDQHDVSIGALFALPSRYLFSDFTHFTAFSRVTCLVPKPKLVKGWLTPITVFTYDIWMWYFGTYAILMFIIYLFQVTILSGPFMLRHGFASNGLIFHVFTQFIAQGQPEYKLPKYNHRRIIHVITLILSLLFAVMYSSRLSSSMIIPSYENDINTPEDLADSDIDWGELFADWVLPLALDTQPISRRLTKKFREGTVEELRTLSIENAFAFGIESLPSGHYAIGEYIQEDIIHTYKVMKEDLYSQYASMQLRKNSALLPSINMLLLQASQAGLLTYWETQATIYHSNMNIQMGIIYPYDESMLIPLSFSHVKGAFGILFLGLSTAACALMYEHKHWKYRQ